MSSTRPETVDERGVTHRHGCPRPGWLTDRSRAVTGVLIARCDGCGAIELRTTAR